MNQQPDKIFREKFQHYQRPVNSRAWERISSNLEKKSSPVIWWRVAAAIVLPATASALLWFNIERYPADEIAVAPKRSGSTAEATQPTVQASTSAQQPTNSETIALELPKAAPTKRVVRKKAKANKVEENRAVTMEQLPQPDIEKEAEVPVAAVAVEEASQQDNAVHEIPVATSRITLVYTATEVNEKYLDKKSLEDATREEKKPSTLRKLLDKASDLKNNQDPFGDLRQKKNEILALNFKNDKQRSQNK